MTIEQIIAELNAMDVDGETMERIIREVGMAQQMHRQLTLSSPMSHTEALLEEMKELERQMINFENSVGFL